MSFDVEIGFTSARGPRERNEDFVAAQRDARGEGLIAAVADGVSAGGQGLMAAQTTVMSLLDDFFYVPAHWETTVALDRLVQAQNAWLASYNRRHSATDGASAMTTLTALVLRGHRWTLAHVGDSRAWLLRGDEDAQISTDHALDHIDLGSRLTRAIGLDERLNVEYRQGDLHVGDCFVLTSDGVHNALKPQRIAALARAAEAQTASSTIAHAAVAAGARDNASVLVLKLRGLAPEQLEDTLALARLLPAPPLLKVGDTLDGYVVTARVSDTGVHRLYQARESASRELVALKTLHEARAGDPEERAMLAHEAWLGLRVGQTDGFVRVREVVGPSALYVVFDWHSGRTLEQMMSRTEPVKVADAVAAAIPLARALGRLHRQGVIHRDIKPGNLHLGDDGHWRILDLGVALSGRESEAQRSLHAGTPSYINPEQWNDPPAAPDSGSDLFAFGVTLYQWLTGALPYGEVEPYQLARFRRDPQSAARRRPDIPLWLDHVLARAVARDPKQRFETAEELLLALERGATRALNAPPPTPLIARDPAALWKIAFAISALFNGLLVLWLLFLPK